MPVTKQPKRKRLVRGRDWHAWAWKYHKSERVGEWGDDVYDLLVWREKPGHKMSRKGRWVHVKFTEVPARKTGE